jgi:hypothetical protein
MIDWEKLYKEAIVETDWSKIQERIEAADFAISARLAGQSRWHARRKSTDPGCIGRTDGSAPRGCGMEIEASCLISRIFPAIRTLLNWRMNKAA